MSDVEILNIWKTVRRILFKFGIYVLETLYFMYNFIQINCVKNLDTRIFLFGN